MKYTHLGRSGLQVSRLCLGTMNFGPHTSEADSHQIMDAALDAGINFFDTANVYGWRIGEGVTEKIIGSWIEKGGGRRDKIVLATKVYGKMGEGVNDKGLSAYHIRKACEDSLKRLKTDHIDLYQMHHIDRNTPWEEIWQAMETLVQQGKIIYVGSSNFAAMNIVQAQHEAAARSFLGLVSEQSLYNLTKREIELEVVPACEEYGLGIIPWSPLASGLLSGKRSRDSAARSTEQGTLERREKLKTNIEAYERFCEELSADPAVVALGWLLKRPAVAAPIIGPRTMRQLESALSALTLDLDDVAMKKLDEIWPGPGGAAPEAYAW